MNHNRKTPLRLKTAIGTYGHTRALKDGTITPDGIELDHVEVKPIIAAFRRMVRDVEFDVCEMAPTTYLIARDAGAPFRALPVFLMRRFHHADFVCRRAANIVHPKDLEGRRVGVRAYSVTTGVWTRAILDREYAVDLDRVNWFVDDEDHVTSFVSPPNVTRLPGDQSIAGQLAAGQIDAALTGPAGIGRAGPPTADWDQGTEPQDDPYVQLFPDAAMLEQEWYGRTGIYPIHGLVVIKDQVVEAHPWVPAALYAAFTAAKDGYVEQLRGGASGTADDESYRRLASIVGPDPLPYGIDANLASITALMDAAHRQHLISTEPSLDSVFLNVNSKAVNN